MCMCMRAFACTHMCVYIYMCVCVSVYIICACLLQAEMHLDIIPPGDAHDALMLIAVGSTGVDERVDVRLAAAVAVKNLCLRRLSKLGELMNSRQPLTGPHIPAIGSSRRGRESSSSVNNVDEGGSTNEDEYYLRVPSYFEYERAMVPKAAAPKQPDGDCTPSSLPYPPPASPPSSGIGLSLLECFVLCLHMHLLQHPDCRWMYSLSLGFGTLGAQYTSFFAACAGSLNRGDYADRAAALSALLRIGPYFFGKLPAYPVPVPETVSQNAAPALFRVTLQPLSDLLEELSETINRAALPDRGVAPSSEALELFHLASESVSE
eukprot:GHVU01138657.1.p1 GENE.GHVU01138657.1~~GHVU01138657.1.p1  ORF type:complete len:321 (+),score=48.96 GHVU01138657.1:1652-2614(+)